MEKSQEKKKETKKSRVKRVGIRDNKVKRNEKSILWKIKLKGDMIKGIYPGGFLRIT